MDASDPFNLVFKALDDYKRRGRTTENATIVVHPLTYRGILSDARYFQHCGDYDTMFGLPLHVCAEVGSDQAVIVAPSDPQSMAEAVEGMICFWRFLNHPAHSVGCSPRDLAEISDGQEWPTVLIFSTVVVVDTTLPRGMFWVQLADRRVVSAVRSGGMECINVIAATPPPPAKPEYVSAACGLGGEDAHDVCDEISALVDEQLTHRGAVAPEKCRCGEAWHGLPITAKMREMRTKGCVERGYSYLTDTSRVLCPGTHMVGTKPALPPRPPMHPLW